MHAGFAGYCIGDPVDEPLTHWLETRWLLVGRHTDDPAKTGARWLSAERRDRRFVSHAYVAPRSPESRLKYLGDECAEGRPPPGQVTMKPGPITNDGVTFDLQVDNAERVGISIAIPRDAIRAGSSIRRVYSEPTGTAGDAKITWRVQRTVEQLVPKRPGPINITALAVACLGPVGPADVKTAAIETFQVATDGTVSKIAASTPTAATMDRLRRAACDSETYTSPTGPSPSTS